MEALKKVGDCALKVIGAIFTGVCFGVGLHAMKTTEKKLDEHQVGEKAADKLADGFRWVGGLFGKIGKKDDCGTACEAPQQPESPATE